MQLACHEKNVSFINDLRWLGEARVKPVDSFHNGAVPGRSVSPGQSCHQAGSSARTSGRR